MVGGVEKQNDFERSSKDNTMQARDKETGLPVWVVEVIDFDPQARTKTYKVKVVAEVQPVPPAALADAPIRPVVLENLTVARSVMPAAKRAGLPGITFHGLRHSFVAILVAAGCNVREVSEWAGHNNVAFTLTRYGGLFEDGSDEAVDRLDALLGGTDPASAEVVELRRTEES